MRRSGKVHRFKDDVSRAITIRGFQFIANPTLIGDLRGNGLFVAIELVDSRDERGPATAAVRRVVNDLRDRGILTNTLGADGNILKLRPPMVFSKENADFFLGHLDEVLATV